MSYTVADEMPIATVGRFVIVCFIPFCANVMGATTSCDMIHTIADEMPIATVGSDVLVRFIPFCANVV